MARDMNAFELGYRDGRDGREPSPPQGGYEWNEYNKGWCRGDRVRRNRKIEFRQEMAEAISEEVDATYREIADALIAQRVCDLPI